MKNHEIEILIRSAIPNDIDSIESLYNDLNDYLTEHINYPRWKKGVYPVREHAEVALMENQLYVAVNNDKIIGAVVYSREQGDAYCSVNWQIDFDVPVIIICKLAVHPAFWGYGVGKAFLDHATVLGQQQGLKAIRLDTYEENLPAIRLYEKCGFSYRGLVDLGLDEIYG